MHELDMLERLFDREPYFRAYRKTIYQMISKPLSVEELSIFSKPLPGEEFSIFRRDIRAARIKSKRLPLSLREKLMRKAARKRQRQARRINRRK